MPCLVTKQPREDKIQCTANLMKTTMNDNHVKDAQQKEQGSSEPRQDSYKPWAVGLLNS